MSRLNLELSGTLFENTICNLIQNAIPNCIVMHDVSVNSSQLGRDTQLDILVLHKKAIILIEAKNWKSWIRGNYNESKWVGKSIGKNIITVFSPVNQNSIHIRSLKSALFKHHIKVKNIHSVVCLPDGASLLSDCTELCNYSKLVSVINQIIKNSCDSLDLDTIYSVIKQISRR